MAAFSDYLENKIVDLVLRGQAFSAPANVFVALHTAAPTDAASGAEVSGGSYARVAIATGLAAFNATQGGTAAASSGTGGVTANASAITFPAPTANWGVVTHFAIRDATTGGNLLFHGALTTPRTINSGDAAPSFAAGALQITLS